MNYDIRSVHSNPTPDQLATLANMSKNFARGNIFTSESYKNVCWAGA